MAKSSCTTMTKLILTSLIALAFSCDGSAPNASISNADDGSIPSSSDLLIQLGYADYVDVKDPDSRASGAILRDKELVSPGWNLISVDKQSEALLFDQNGKLINRWHAEAEHWGVCELLPNGDLIVPELTEDSKAILRRMNWQGETIWITEGGKDGRDDLVVHHDVEVRPDGLVSTLSRTSRTDIAVDDELPFGDEHVALVDPKNGSLIEQRSFYDMWLNADTPLPWLEKRWKDLPRGGGRIDLFHSNSVEWMWRPKLSELNPIFSQGNVLVSFRHQACIAIFDWEEERMIWNWGRGELSGAHDATVLSNGNILVFDNGINRKWSRVVELDPLKREIVWQYQGTSEGDLWSRTRGSSQRIEGSLLNALRAGPAAEFADH